jgi:hypothetical protein
MVGGIAVHSAHLLDEWSYRRALERKLAATP